MKRIIASTIFAILSIGSFAQDMIVKKDGSVIQAKVSEIGTSEVKYKKWSNQDGPLFVIAKSDILAITYQNGEKETFSDAPISVQESKEQSEALLIERPASANNSEVIARYNKDLKLTIQDKIWKNTKTAVGVFAFGDNSVLSNDDVEIQFVVSKSKSPATMLGDPVFRQNAYLLFRYCVIAKNKTNNTIYFDLANCTRSNSKTMEVNTFYTGESVSVSHGSSTGAGVGIGGVIGAVGLGGGLGVSTSGSSTRTYSQDRIISIPPHSFKVIADFKIDQVKGQKCEIVSRGEELLFGFNNNAVCHWWGEFIYQKSGIPHGTIKKNEIINYTYSNSPLVLDYKFLYSSKSDFSEYSIITANLFLKELIGLPWEYQGYFRDWTKNWTNKFKAIDSYLEGYDENTICGAVVLE